VVRTVQGSPLIPKGNRAELTSSTACVSFFYHRLLEAVMKFSIRIIDEVVIIDVEGKIILGDGDTEIKKEVDDLLKQGKRKVILNLAKVSYLDSAGLGQLIQCFTALRKNGGNFKLLSPNQRIIDLLHITKLLNVFDYYDNESTAVGSF
jgi:anti-sigma B factor antagonist